MQKKYGISPNSNTFIFQFEKLERKKALKIFKKITDEKPPRKKIYLKKDQ